MALVNQELFLEITPGAIPPILNVTEYDENMQVIIHLRQRGQAFEIPSGVTAKVEGTLAGHPFRVDATPSGSTVSFELSKAMTGYAGRAWTKIKLINDDKPVHTCGFWLDCDRAGVEAGDVIAMSGFEEQIQTSVDNYLTAQHIVIDDTLSHKGSAAEASETGRRLTAIERGELTQVDDVNFVPGFVRENGTINHGSNNYYFTDMMAYKGGDVYFRIATVPSFGFSVVAFYDASKTLIGTLNSALGSDEAVWDAYYNGEALDVSPTTGNVLLGELEGVLTKSQIRFWFPNAAYVAVSSFSPTNAWYPTQMAKWRGALCEQRYVVDLFNFNVQAALDRVNVVTYGAKGDGSTDDSAAFAAAIDALGVGDTLYVPAGVYRVSAVNLKSHMTICGDGFSSVIQLMPGLTGFSQNQNCINVHECEDVIIRDLKLDGLRTTQSSTGAAQDQRLNGIWICQSAYVLIDHVWLYNNGYHGAIITNSMHIKARDVLSTENGFRPYHAHTKCYDITVEGMETRENGLGLTGGSGNLNDAIFFFGVQRLNITGCILRANRRGCISIAGDSADLSGADAIQTRDVSISGCVCNCLQNVGYERVDDELMYFPSYGIDIQGDNIANVSVSGCTIRNAWYGVYVHGFEEIDANVVVSGVAAIDCTYSVYLQSAKRVALHGVSSEAAKRCAVYATLSEALLLDGLIVHSTENGGGGSIDLESVNGCTIIGCRLDLNGCYTFGVFCHGSPASDKVLVTGSTIDGATSSAVVLTGSNSKAVNNIIDGVYTAEVSV